MPTKKLIAAVTVASLALVAGGITIALSTSAAEAEPLAVTGFADAATTGAQLAASSTAITAVGIDGVNLTDDGSNVTAPSSDILKLLADGHSRGKHVELLVGNFDEEIGDFSPDTAARLLGSPDNIATVVASLAAEVDQHDWDGVSVDFENLTRADAPGLTQFVKALDKALGADRTISVCLTATTGSYGELGYQLGSLAKLSDRLIVMAYDQHNPATEAGPVAGTPWVTKALSPLLQKVKPAQIELGVAGYGYSWPADGGPATQVSIEDARALVIDDGTKAVWNGKQKEWHATLTDGTELWWSDERTYDARYALARQLHLHGVAVWSLTLSSPIQP